MKNNLLYILILLSIGMFSCKKSEYLLYNIQETNKIYFKYDTLKFNYGMLQDKEVDLLLSAGLIGMVDKNADRDFTITINQSLTTAEAGKHYTVPATLQLHKDSANASIPLDFHKDNMEFDKEYLLTIELQSNAQFQATDVTRSVIIFANKSIPAPVWWRSDRLGDYNQDKLILFVTHYTATKDNSSVLYNKIKNTWGEHLITGTPINLLTIAEYREYIKRYILIPMYDYYLETNEERYKIPNPNI